MKATIQLTLLATIASSYAMVIERDTPIKQAIIDVTTAINNMGAIAKDPNGNVNSLLKACDSVISSIENGQKTCQSAASIGLGDAATLLGPIEDLDNSASALLDHIKVRVSAVAAAKQCGTARSKLQVIDSSGHQLIQTVTNKLSSDFARNMAQQYVRDTNGILDKYTELFSAANCVDYN